MLAKLCLVEDYINWVTVAGIGKGAVFQRIDRWGNLSGKEMLVFWTAESSKSPSRNTHEDANSLAIYAEQSNQAPHADREWYFYLISSVQRLPHPGAYGSAYSFWLNWPKYSQSASTTCTWHS